MVQAKNIHVDQWNRIKDPDMNLHSYAHLIFNKGAKNIGWRKHSLFNTCCWEKWLSACTARPITLYQDQLKVD
jgi:hypothetical protein